MNALSGLVKPILVPAGNASNSEYFDFGVYLFGFLGVFLTFGNLNLSDTVIILIS